MSGKIDERFRTLARDKNLDIEDVATAFAGEKADKPTIDAVLAQYDAILEPAAKRLLSNAKNGTLPALPNRTLLAKGPADDVAYSRNDVLRLQDALTDLGIATGSDGRYGSGTAASVRAFQARAHLPETGNLDSNTLLAINVALTLANKPLLDIQPRARVRPDSVIALKNGSNTAATTALQTALNALPGAKVRTDGVFDQATEDRVREFQATAYLPETGVLDTNTAAALKLNVAPPAGGAGFKGKVELHFYPGDQELKVYVMKNGKVLDTYGMVGGNEIGRADTVHNNGINYNPSPRGTYDIVGPETIVSWSWPFSRVPTGSQLREVDGEVQYRSKDGAWHFATGPNGDFRNAKDTLSKDYYKDENGELLDTWMGSDFGHISGLLRSRNSGKIIGSIIHSGGDTETTAEYFNDTASLRDSSEALSRLGHSHGCEHIHPRDMDELIAKGYIGSGTVLVIHGYDETHR